MTTDDPVRVARARAARLTAIAQRCGYSLWALAIAFFAAGLLVDFTGFVAAAVITCLVLGSVVLAPAIIVGYGVKAAEREDRRR